MYWATPTPPSQSSGAAVFDTSAPAVRFQGVLVHLPSRGPGKIARRERQRPTALMRFHPIPHPTQVTGIIGAAQQFNWLFRIISTSSGPQAANLISRKTERNSVSAWVKVNPFPNQSSVIVHKTALSIFAGNFATIISGSSIFSTIASGVRIDGFRRFTGVWTHVEGVRSGPNQCFYVNGAPCASLAADTMQPGQYARIQGFTCMTSASAVCRLSITRVKHGAL